MAPASPPWAVFLDFLCFRPGLWPQWRAPCPQVPVHCPGTERACVADSPRVLLPSARMSASQTRCLFSLGMVLTHPMTVAKLPLTSANVNTQPLDAMHAWRSHWGVLAPLLSLSRHSHGVGLGAQCARRPRRSIGRSTSQARNKRTSRSSETDDQRQERLNISRQQMALARSSETSEQREIRLEADRSRHALLRSKERQPQRATRLANRRAQNINPPKLCNGTRLSVKTLMKNIIEATILNRKFKGTDVLLPRIPLIPTDMPFEFKRLQFPVRLAFAMTINKAQGQSLQVCGLDLEIPCFSHGQLYVTCSRLVEARLGVGGRSHEENSRCSSEMQGEGCQAPDTRRIRVWGPGEHDDATRRTCARAWQVFIGQVKHPQGDLLLPGMPWPSRRSGTRWSGRGPQDLPLLTRRPPLPQSLLEEQMRKKLPQQAEAARPNLAHQSSKARPLHRRVHHRPDAIVIKTNGSTSYADILKTLKGEASLQQTVGSSVHNIRRSASGALVLQLKKGVENASSLGAEIEKVLGPVATASARQHTSSIEIKDLDECVDEAEIDTALGALLGVPVSQAAVKSLRRAYAWRTPKRQQEWLEPSRGSCPTPVGPEVADASSMPTSSTLSSYMEHLYGAAQRRRRPTSDRQSQYTDEPACEHHSQRYDNTLSALCPACPLTIEDADHVFFHCPRFSVEREELQHLLQEEIEPGNITRLMLEANENWLAVSSFAHSVVTRLRQEAREA
ncbi:unnamed protein product [Trichogramma brassicae]|uniref:ATP-dependent DNA helicase n=1 Tax=Trichogramma brassicae TaxID=86971 RepID=A0A6H5II95_9HYME|nr:unnamed protein product [Trichogramma brassicae]